MTTTASRDMADPMIAAQVRLPDGRLFDGPLPAARHRALQLGLLHSHTTSFVEIAAGHRPAGGKLRITTRERPDHFLPGGASGRPDWLTDLLALAADHDERGEEVFVGVCGRDARRAGKAHVHESRFVWVDVDRAGALHRLWALLERTPAHLIVESGGSGGAHAYWKLREPLPAVSVTRGTGETVEWIERANQRLIQHLGVDADGRPNVADPACKDRSRLMRLAGTVNHKTGRHARIVRADFQLPGYSLAELVGALPDPDHYRPRTQTATRAVAGAITGTDPYRLIDPPAYFERIAGLHPDRRGFVRCPFPDHEDRSPSCMVGASPEDGWFCYGCGRGGRIYDLASAVTGGPVGGALRGAAFRHARDHVARRFAGPTPLA